MSPWRERDVAMLAAGDARQRGARLALAAGAEEEHVLVGQRAGFVFVDDVRRRPAAGRRSCAAPTMRCIERPTRHGVRPAALRGHAARFQRARRWTRTR